MYRTAVVTVSVFACLPVATVTGAGITQIFMVDGTSDRSAWEAAVGGNFTLETFDDSNLVTGLSLTGATFVPGRFQDGATTTNSATLAFDPGVYAAGLWVDLDPQTVGIGLDLIVHFVGGGSDTIEVRSNVTNPDGPGFTGFVGFTADKFVDHVVIIGGDQFNLGSGELYHGDDVVFSPEPSTFILTTLGLLVLAACGWRRRPDGSCNMGLR